MAGGPSLIRPPWRTSSTCASDKPRPCSSRGTSSRALRRRCNSATSATSPGRSSRWKVSSRVSFLPGCAVGRESSASTQSGMGMILEALAEPTKEVCASEGFREGFRVQGIHRPAAGWERGMKHRNRPRPQRSGPRPRIVKSRTTTRTTTTTRTMEEPFRLFSH